MPKQILIVDARTFTTKIASQEMTKMGFTGQSAQSAEDAVGNLEAHGPPSLFFVDWVMPGMSGVEFVSWLRDERETKSTPVVTGTAQRDLTQISEAVQKGTNEYVMKPFSKEVIAEKLELFGIGSGR